jgi:murein DD-endopeptidase MepM/ murein hydrolase activator NlpD
MSSLIQQITSLNSNSPINLGEANSKSWVKLDLSQNNPQLKLIDVSSSQLLSEYINSHINEAQAKVAWGGYLEQRNIYQRSTYFNSTAEDERNIHLGIDIWAAAGTEVFAPVDGVIHSFNNNTNYGDYGPTIIIAHEVEGFKFHTLYGHLSLSSIKNIKQGDIIKGGSKVGNLGASDVNGDYPPHLHFQIVIDMQDLLGDYPGVCSQKDLEFYKKNCPDPNILLAI